MATKPIQHIDAVITSGYGQRVLNGVSQMHQGIDIAVKGNPIDVPVHCAYDGIIAWIDNSHPVYDPKTGTGSFGRVVYVKLPDGWYCVYPHLAEINPELKLNTIIHEGDHIGIMGNTGYSFDIHLHFEIRKTMSHGNSRCPQEIINLYDEKKSV